MYWFQKVLEMFQGVGPDQITAVCRESNKAVTLSLSLSPSASLCVYPDDGERPGVRAAER